MDGPDRTELEEIVVSIFEKIPFNGVLGLRIVHIEEGLARVRFEMRDELVGNYVRRILHGGVISATLDVTAGLVAFMGLAKRMRESSMEDKLARFSRLGTIDMRVDYLRPAAGEHFVASARVLRSGSRIAVIHTELHDDANELVASGTCTYLVG